MNLLKLSDCQLSHLQEEIANESRRRTRLAANGHDPMSGIWGNEAAKRAVTVAAAGKHSTLFVGPANSGKTLLRALALELGVEHSFEARHCPCGNYGDPLAQCSCTARQINRAVAKFPLVDITVEVCRPKPREFNAPGSTMACLRESIGGMSHHTDESLGCDAAALLKAATEEFALDLVAISRILHVARTIANLDNARLIAATHVSEAINYRALRHA